MDVADNWWVLGRLVLPWPLARENSRSMSAGDEYWAHGCDTGFEGASPTNPEGGPESRLWATVARRGPGRPNSLARRRILTAWRYIISMPS